MACELCDGTGFVQRGMVITPRYADSYVDWVVNLVACSHGVIANAAENLAGVFETSGKAPEGTDNHTGPLRSERVARPEEVAPGLDTPLGGGPGAADRGGAA